MEDEEAILIMSWYEFNSFVLAKADFCIVISLYSSMPRFESYSFSSYFSLVVHTLALQSVHIPRVVKVTTERMPTLLSLSVEVLS